MGEFVDPSQAPAPSSLTPEEAKAAHGGGWLESSLDLLKGTEVIENPDEASDDLFDSFWGTPGEVPPR